MIKALYVVEAALFSAGRALSVQEIMDQTDLDKAAVEKAIKALQKVYADRDTVLEVSKAGTKWAMQVQTQAAAPAAKFAAMEIAPKLLKTLALIAYHQPMKQSELVDMIGTKVYDHIPELKERGLVRTRRDGPTKILTTTDRFPEYFGLDAASPDQVRTVLAKMVGLPPPDKKKEKGLQSFGSEAGDPLRDPEAAGPDTAADEGAKTPQGTHDPEAAGPDTAADEGAKTAQDAPTPVQVVEEVEDPPTA